MACQPFVGIRDRRTRSARAFLTALVASVVLLGLAAPGALAHASFLGATPSPGERIEVSPAMITLRFSENLNRRLSGAELSQVDGSKINAKTVGGGSREIVLEPDVALKRGAYRVQWHSVSTDDGHPLEGSFGFGLRVSAVGGQSFEQRPFADGGWARAIARIALYVTLLLFAGALGLAALLQRGEHGPRWIAPRPLDDTEVAAAASATRARTPQLLGDIGLFALACAALSAIADATIAARGLDPSGLRDFLLGSFTGFARVLVVLMVALAWALRRRPILASLAATAALAFLATAGHANSARPRGWAILTDWIHLCAGALWLGGLAFVLLAWGPALLRGGRPARAALMHHVLPRFGAVALPAFVVVVLSGSANALIELGRVTALWDSDYGLILSAKIVLVAVIAALSYVHALRLRPRLTERPAQDPPLERRIWRLLRLQPALAIGVVALVGLLVVFPLPPRQLDRADRALAAAVPNCDPCPLPSPRPDELSVAALGGSRVIAAWISRGPHSLRGTVRALDTQGRPAPGSMRIGGGAATGRCGPGCVRFTTRAATRDLSISGVDQGRAFTVTVPATWRAGAGGRARRLLDRAQRTMRELSSVQEFEHVTSGPGTSAITRYRLLAPDRFALRTDAGVESITIAARQWQRLNSMPWRESSVPGGLPFSFRTWFRWTPYAAAVRLLSETTIAGRRVAELALADPATPVWTRIRIDERSGLVFGDRQVAQSRDITTRYHAFNGPLSIQPPKVYIRNDG